ncbi:hypothetical protein H0H93_002105 [Arthromyces matolae]|nr:hypothetical protein H0H93_002105 [Arthromyces matolae]
MAKTDRGKFVVNPRYGYKDLPQKLGYGATMSGPQMVRELKSVFSLFLVNVRFAIQHAFTASTLLPYLTPGSRVLDVGSGSGYLTAVFHHLVGREGLVVGIDHVPELIERSKRILEEIGLERELRYGRILFVNGDGRDGYPEGGPYDVIHVGAASPVPPPKLIQQLASPGKMFIPIGGEYQNIVIISKDENGRVGTEIIVPFIEPLSPAKFDLLRDLDKQLEEGEKKEKEKEKEGFGRREVLKMRSHS